MHWKLSTILNSLAVLAAGLAMAPVAQAQSDSQPFLKALAKEVSSSMAQVRIRVVSRYSTNHPRHWIVDFNGPPAKITIEITKADLANPYAVKEAATHMIRLDDYDNFAGIAGIFQKYQVKYPTFSFGATLADVLALEYDLAHGDPAALLGEMALDLRIKDNVLRDTTTSNRSQEQKWRSDIAKLTADYHQKAATIGADIQSRKQMYEAEIARLQPKLADAIANNDRDAYVSRLVKIIPWDLIGPSEQNYWKHLINAIRFPDLGQKVLVFRGVNGNFPLNGAPILTAPVFWNGNPAESELAGLFLKRQIFNSNHFSRLLGQKTHGSTVHWYEYFGSATKANGFGITNAETEIPTSSDFDVADGYARTDGQTLALLVNEDRLIFGVKHLDTQTYVDEHEHFLMLGAFPDEVVYSGQARGARALEAIKASVKAEGYSLKNVQLSLDTDIEKARMENQFFRFYLSEAQNPPLVPSSNKPQRAEAKSARESKEEDLVFKGKPIEPGDVLTIDRRKYTLISFEAHGSPSSGTSIFKLQDSNNDLFALKILRNYSYGDGSIDPIDAANLQEESERLFPLLDKLGIDHPEVIFAGNGFILRKWSSGQSGEEWAEQWKRSRYSTDFPGYRELEDLFGRVVKARKYINDLSPSNLNWKGRRWEVFDVGHTVKEKLSAADAASESAGFFRHWTSCEGSVEGFYTAMKRWARSR